MELSLDIEPLSKKVTVPYFCYDILRPSRKNKPLSAEILRRESKNGSA
jgi:hypothetical protein